MLNGRKTKLGTSSIHGIIQLGWNKWLQGRDTISSSSVRSFSQIGQAGEDSVEKTDWTAYRARLLWDDDELNYG